jgi:D-ribose pyranase
MLRTGILNPHLNSLLSRVRHANSLVIADRRFPFWPQIDTIDHSLGDYFLPSSMPQRRSHRIY